MIGIDVSRANTQTRTGVEWYAFRLIQALKHVARDASITLYSPTPPLPDWGQFPERWRWKALASPLKRLWNTIILRRELSRRTPAVFFTPAYGLLMPLPKKLRSVATIHDLAFITHPHLYSRWDRMLQRLVLRRTVRQACRIIVPSRATFDDLQRVYPIIPEEKIVIIPHGMHHPIPRHHEERHPGSFLFVGRIEHKKNLLPFLDALEMLAHRRGFSDISITLVGQRGYGFGTIRKLIQSCPRHIQWLGWVGEDTLDALRERARFLALPSIVEGFGLPLLEAWEHGMIPIVTDIPALKEVGEDGAFYLNHKDPGSWPQRIEELLRSPDEQQKVLAAAKQRSRNFNWRQSAEATLNVLTSCV